MIFPSPAGMSLTKLSLWPGIIKLFPSKESLVGHIPAGDGKIDNLFYRVDVSEPTPAVPGRPVTPEKGPPPPATSPPPPPAAVPSLPDRTRVRNRFNQFLETTTQPLLQDNIIAVVDLQKGRSPEKIPSLKTTLCKRFLNLCLHML